MEADRVTRALILSSVPQQPPFRFLDEILELSEDRITGAYRFREDEYFYRGHFPRRPITPGVILIETMAQTGVVALGLYLTMLRGDKSEGRISNPPPMITLFTTAEEVEFNGIVLPGERVIIRGEKVYFRRGSLKTRITMERENGESICTGLLSGTGVMLNEN